MNTGRLPGTACPMGSPQPTPDGATKGLPAPHPPQLRVSPGNLVFQSETGPEPREPDISGGGGGSRGRAWRGWELRGRRIPGPRSPPETSHMRTPGFQETSLHFSRNLCLCPSVCLAPAL